MGKQTTFTNNACSRVNPYFEMKQKSVIRDSLVANTFLFSTIIIDSNFGIKHEQHIRREIRLEGGMYKLAFHLKLQSISRL